MATMVGLPKAVEKWFSPSGKGAIGRDQKISAQLGELWNKEKTQREAAQRLIDWQRRHRTKIVEYIKKQATITFGDETKEWQLPVINGVRRVVRNVSMTYKAPPERKYFRNDTELAADSPEVKKIERMYQRLDLNKCLREIERWSTLLNTVHLEIVYRRGAIHWDTHKRPHVLVIPAVDDYLQIDVFARRIELESGTRIAKGFILWREQEYYFIRDDGFIFAPADGLTGENPFKEANLEQGELPIPIVTIRKEDDEDYWGRYGADIVDSFEQAAIQLSNLWENTFLQAHGQPIGTNLGLKKNDRLRVGPRHPITVEGVIKDQVPPSLAFAKAETDIVEVRDLIDWYVKSASGTYGMAAAAWAQEQKVQSGFAKLVENLELLEERDEVIPDWVRREKELFEKSRMVWNYWHEVQAEHIDEDIRLEVTFKEVEFPESPQESAAADAIRITSNTASVVDVIMKERKISNRDEAFKLAQQIVTENATLTKLKLDTIGPDPNAPGFNGGDRE